jgi:hypothetical protein
MLGQSPAWPSGEGFRTAVALLEAFAETGLVTNADVNELLIEAGELADQ